MIFEIVVRFFPKIFLYDHFTLVTFLDQNMPLSICCSDSLYIHIFVTCCSMSMMSVMFMSFLHFESMMGNESSYTSKLHKIVIVLEFWKTLKGIFNKSIKKSLKRNRCLETINSNSSVFLVNFLDSKIPDTFSIKWVLYCSSNLQ